MTLRARTQRSLCAVTRSPLVHAAAAALDLEHYFVLRRERDGDPFRVDLPGLGETWLTGDPAGARALFTAPPEQLSPPRPNPVEPLLGEGSLILLGGERHQRERRLLMPMLSGERMRSYGRAMLDETLEAIEDLAPGAPLDVVRLSQRITLRVIIRAVFGVEGAARRAQYEGVIARLLAAYTPALVLVPALRRAGFGPWARFQAHKRELDSLLNEELDSERAGGDLLASLRGARREDGSRPTRDELLDELRTLLVAGHETTAATMAWALHRIHRTPEVARALVDELATLGHSPEAEPLVALPLLSAAVSETLRLHPVVPVVLRQLAEPLELAGRTVPRGATAGVAVRLLHTHPGTFPSPETFDPQRFLARKFTPFEYAPFGGGHRRCLGAAFASYELRIALGALLARHELALHPEDRGASLPPVTPQGIIVAPRRAPRFVCVGPRQFTSVATSTNRSCAMRSP